MNAYLESENLRFLSNAWFQRYLKNGIGAFYPLGVEPKTEAVSVATANRLDRPVNKNLSTNKTKQKV